MAHVPIRRPRTKIQLHKDKNTTTQRKNGSTPFPKLSLENINRPSVTFFQCLFSNEEFWKTVCKLPKKFWVFVSQIHISCHYVASILNCLSFARTVVQGLVSSSSFLVQRDCKQKYWLRSTLYICSSVPMDGVRAQFPNLVARMGVCKISKGDCGLGSFGDQGQWARPMTNHLH